MALPKFLQPYLASYDLSKLDKDTNAVREEIITQVLNLGDEEAVEWIFDNYDMDQVRYVLKNPKRGLWFKESLNFWQKILGIEAKDSLNKDAIFTNP